MPEQKLQGKIAVVTGGGSGIGRATSLLFAQEGAKVYMLDFVPEDANDTRAMIEKAGGTAAVIDCDIAKPQLVEQAFSRIGDQEGSIDIVFANAGINGAMTPIETMDIEEWDRTMNTNLRGTFATVKYAIPHMKQKGGSIVITSSVNGNRVFSGFGFAAYSSTKAGQVAFMKMAALELAQYKIRVNAVCPGAIETNIGENTFPSDDLKKVQIPIEFPKGSQPLEKGPGSPEQVAKLVLFLAGEDSSHITGTKIYIDGAESLLRG